MMRNKYYIVLFLLTSVGVTNVYAQFPDINKSFTNYKSKFPASRLHLIFNQPFYSPGDTIYFSAWNLNESNKIMPGKQVGSLDLLDENGYSVKRIHFKIENGRASNQLTLPKDLQPGSYTVIAYTAWMRNFSDDWFYRKRIEIKGRNESIPARMAMTAGVEGGNLVAGISNHLVVSVADYPGALITVRNGANEEVANTSLDSTGIASINFTPVAGDQYTISGPNNSKKQLPAAKQDGVVISLGGDTFTFTAAGKYQDAELRAVFTSQGEIVDIRRVKFTDGMSTTNAPLDMAGLFHQVFLIDEDKNLVAGRVFVSDGVRRDVGTLAVSEEAFQRDNVSLTIDVPSAADLVVTAYQQDLFKTNTLKQSFYLSELPEVFQWADKYIDYERSLNTFLVTQHWARIDWAEILSGKPKVLAYPIYNILTTKGILRSKLTREPAPDSTNVILYMEKNTAGYDSYTKEGRFEISYFYDFWDTDHLFISLQHRTKGDLTEDYEVLFDPDTISIPAITPGRQLTAPGAYGTYSFNKQMIASSFAFFSKPATDNKDQEHPNALIEDELGEIDIEVNVEKYVVFPSMEDLVREVVPFVQYKKKGRSPGIRVILRYPKGNFAAKNNPLFVIDGVLTRDIDFFMRIKPKDVSTIKVVNNPQRLLALGKIGEHGVILIDSKKETLADSLRQVNTHTVTGLNTAIPFYQPKLTSTSTRVPDLRSTLFWDPKLKAEAAGKTELSFVTGDDVGPVTVLVQGLTSEGVPIFLEKRVDVKFRWQP